MNLFKPSFCLSLIIFLCFSFTNRFVNYQIECISVEDNYVTIKIWNPKKGKSYKIDQANKDALYAILYTGIAGSKNCLTQKALLTNSEEIDKFSKIEKEFFSSKGKWTQYTRSSTTETTLPANLGSKNWKVYQVSVSKDALKKYLEEKSILKSINTGF